MNKPAAGWLPDWTRIWVQDSSVLLLSQFATVAMTSTLAIFIARNLGPSDWGIFSGILGLSMALSAFAGLGLATWLLRELSALWRPEAPDAEDDRREAGRLVGGALTLSLCLSVGLVLSAFVATRLVGWEADRSLALVGLTAYTALIAASSVLETVFRSRRALGSIVVATFLEKGILLSLVVFALLVGGGLSGIALGYVVAATVRVVFNGVRIGIGGTLRFSLPRPRALRDIVGRSMPFALNAASLSTIPRLDTFLVAALSTTAAGYFAAGDRVVGPALIISASATSALYPFLARKQDGAGAWRLAGLLGLLGAVLAVVGSGAAPFLVPAVFGSQYTEAVRTVQVMVFVLPFSFFVGGIMAWLYSNGQEQRVLLVTAVAGIGGTAAIVAGHALAGPTGAGVGYLLRQILLAAALGGLALSYDRAVVRRAAVELAPTGGAQ